MSLKQASHWHEFYSSNSRFTACQVVSF